MLHYVTTNQGKVREARDYLGGTVEGYDFDYLEIQSDDVGAIAAHGAREAYREVGEPVLVDDAGLFVDALGGFPGPYSSYVEDTVGVERVWRLGRAEDDRSAAFKCVLAYCDGDGFDESTVGAHDADTAGRDLGVVAEGEYETEVDLPVRLFAGEVRGELVAPRGDGGFGYDPIFEHEGQTLAEMSTGEKNAVSHRGRALETFAAWYEDARLAE